MLVEVEIVLSKLLSKSWSGGNPVQADSHEEEGTDRDKNLSKRATTKRLPLDWGVGDRQRYPSRVQEHLESSRAGSDIKECEAFDRIKVCRRPAHEVGFEAISYS